MTRGKLLVEQKAEELIAEVARLKRGIRYECKASRDLERSADSAFLNIGEGTAHFAPKMKISKYEIARGEVKEVQTALRALVLKGKLKETDTARAEDLADHLIALLTNLIKSIQSRP